MAAPTFSSGEQQFAEIVSKQTGLQLVTVLAWIHAERGPAGNPLNIGPGRDYRTPRLAAYATVDLLRKPTYAPVLATAQTTSDPRSQLAAIAASPWDAGHYTAGRSVPAGTTLYGALAAVAGSAAANKKDDGGFVPGFPDIGDINIPNPVTAVTGVVGDGARWVETKAATGLAYVVLTFAALALIVMGLADVFGVGPAAVRAEVGRRRTLAAEAREPLPF
jgi:hypothetical protein